MNIFLSRAKWGTTLTLETCHLPNLLSGEEPDPATSDSPSLLLFPFFFAWKSSMAMLKKSSQKLSTNITPSETSSILQHYKWQNKIWTLLSTKPTILKPTQLNYSSCTLRSLDLYQCWHLWAIFGKAALIFNDMQELEEENNQKTKKRAFKLI